MALVAAPAWAVGEKIILPSEAQPFASQIKDTLCVSMDCVADKSGGLDATVTGKLIKAKKGQTEVELQVVSSTGAVKATVKAPVNDQGRISSMDLVTATSAMIAAIEGPEPKAKKVEPAAKMAKLQKKKSQVRLAAKARFGHSRG
jgi:hypothetical protein